MAGILGMIPGLIAGKLGAEDIVGGIHSSGILDTLKNAAGGILSDLGSGRVNSWSDFGKSLARSGAKALGAEVPEHDQKVSSSIAATKAMLDQGNNAANERTMIQTADQPKAKMFTPYSPEEKENARIMKERVEELKLNKLLNGSSGRDDQEYRQLKADLIRRKQAKRKAKPLYKKKK